MDDSSRIKIGISFNPYGKTYGRYGNDTFSALKRHGYSAADYNISDTNIELYHLHEDDLKRKITAEKMSAQSAGVVVSQVHGPWRWPPQDNSEQERGERLEKMKRAVVITALLGCKHLVIHPIMPYGTEDLILHKEQETWGLNRQFFKALVDFAKPYDVTICLENMPMKDFSLSKPEHILAFVKDFNDAHLQICLDTGHVAVFPDLSVGDEMRRLGGFIKAFHIHDNGGDRDAHLYPTKGIIDWADFADAVQEIEYRGVLSLETAPPSSCDDLQFEQESAALYTLFYELIRNHGNHR